MGSLFYLFSATRLSVSKSYLGVIWSSCKVCEILPVLSPSILYYHILPLSTIWNCFASALQNSWHPGYDFFSLKPSFYTGLLRCIIGSMLEWGTQIWKNGLATGVKIWGNAAKSGKDSHLLVIMCMRLSQKISLHNLTNWSWFKKLNG